MNHFLPLNQCDYRLNPHSSEMPESRPGSDFSETRSPAGSSALRFLLFVLFSLIMLISCQKKDAALMAAIELNFDWKFRQSGETAWMDATVPGTVHTDLMANGVIDDPFYRLNEHDVQWIDKVDWEYRTIFGVNADILGRDRIALDFKGLDTYADVYLNGREILKADNMFREWMTDIKPYLKEGSNELRIVLRSPIAEGIKKYDAQGFEIPVSDNDLAVIGQVPGGKKVSIYTRKAGYHFGWDWGPRLVTSGIWRPVYLKAWDDVRIASVQIVQKEVSEEVAYLTAVFELDAQSAGNAILNIENEGVVLAYEKVRLLPGINKYKVDFEITNPRLWWTNGLGEAYLYDVTAKVDVGKRSVSESHRIGIRTIEFVRDKDNDGTSFYFKLNGIPVFMKGVNYIPNDVFLPRVTAENYRKVIHTAKISNMNMIRIWGGGVYEDDLFYELCNEAGILVWQDFMFGCAMFPGDQAFLENVRQEAIDNVKRLRNHPSVAFWCGNNENLVAWYNWGWKRAEEAKNPENAAKIWKYYEDVFHDILPAVVAEYDPQKAYWSSSPSSGPGIVPDLVSGDEHYWGVWWGKEPFEKYATHIARFMSEYGFQSFPEIATVKKYALPEDYDIFSEVMKSHQRSSIGNGTIEYYMLKEFNRPKDFESFLYVGQVLQAEGIKFGLEGHRRAAPFCMGSLYWQLNDVWPVASWSSTDYYQRWKALQYYVQKGFEPVLVSPWKDGPELKVTILNDKLVDLNATLKVRLLDFEGKELNHYQSNVVVPANSSSLVFAENQEKFLAGNSAARAFIVTELITEDEIISSNVLYLKPFRDLRLPNPEVKVAKVEVPGGFEFTFTSDKLARNVYLQIGDEQGFFSDNYFDLLPGESKTVRLDAELSGASLDEVFRIRTLVDAF